GGAPWQQHLIGCPTARPLTEPPIPVAPAGRGRLYVQPRRRRERRRGIRGQAAQGAGSRARASAGEEDAGKRDFEGRHRDRTRKKTHLAVALAIQKRHAVSTIARTLGVARSNLLVQARREPGAPLALGTRSDRSRGCERRDGRQEADAELLAELRPFIDERTTYGYRRAGGLLNPQR